jgi:signal transduction histidine kinase
MVAKRTKGRQRDTFGRLSALLLLGAFVLISGAFIASTAYSEVEASAIDGEVLAIESNSLPSVEHIAAASTALRQLEIEADEYAEELPDHREHERRTASEARHDIDRELSAYLETPMYPGEQPLYNEVARTLASLDAAIQQLYDFAASDHDRAEAFADRTLRPVVRQADAALRNLSALNEAALHREVAQIADIRHRTIRKAVLLDSACLLFAVGAAIVAMRAIRRQRRIERAHERVLETRARELEMFASRVAHDLLSPLSALSFTLLSVRRNAERGDPFAEPMARAFACMTRAQQLVAGVLEFARAAMVPSAAARSEIREAITGVVDETTGDEKARVEIVVEPFQDVAVVCSSGVLASILSNLIRNAVKYMDDDGERRITVRVRTKQDDVLVEVEDTGPGIPTELEAHIFEPYVRAPNNVKPGLGLGLSTVKRFVDAHRGRVGVRSVPGRGCVFWFELPRAESRAVVADHFDALPVSLA